MTDYTKASGSGQIMIRVTSSTVYFYVQAGSTQTWFGSATYSWNMNGSGSGTFSYSTGGAWKLIRSANVTSSQTVTFSIGSTGTSGLGGPTSLSVAVNRASPPPAPTPVTFSLLTGTSVYTTFHSNGSNGATVTQWQLAYHNANTTSGATVKTSDGTLSVVGLARGTTYYFWARGYNSEGWGPWSSVRSIRTLQVPDAPDPVVLSNITQTTVHTQFTGNGNGGAAVTQWQLGYGTSATAPQISVTSTGTLDVTGLTPGATYYFWARGLNSVGWGPYSARTSSKSKAGAYVLVGGVWKEAIPYVRVAGVWKVAEPWVRVYGIWKKTG
jgi:hypothetical protein